MYINSFLIVIAILIYLILQIGFIYLSYLFIKYINNLEAKGCKCSENIKRDIIKNISIFILISWIFFVIFIIFMPNKNLNKIISNKSYHFIIFLIMVGYGWLLFSYSRKLIDESCECSDHWLRDVMQYQSYIYIFMGSSSLIIFLSKILLGNDKKEIYKIINGLK